MSPMLTRGVLGLGLASTLVAAWFAPAPADNGVELAERTRTAGARTSTAEAPPAARGGTAAQRTEVLRIRPREAAPGQPGAPEALFGATRWTPAPPPPPPVATVTVQAAPPPPPPQAPPLPFRVMGRYIDGTEVAVFLQYNNESLVVRVGDTVAQNYKVESLEGSTLTLLYTPLNQKQTLDVGGSEPKDPR